jgi:hypothetical protein
MQHYFNPALTTDLKTRAFQDIAEIKEKVKNLTLHAQWGCKEDSFADTIQTLAKPRGFQASLNP